jgi:septum site-determining protein MinC
VSIKPTKSIAVAYEALREGSRGEYEAIFARYQASPVSLALDISAVANVDFAFLARLVDMAVLKEVKLLALATNNPDVKEFVEHLAVAVIAPSELTNLGEAPIASKPLPTEQLSTSLGVPYTRVLTNPLRSGMQIQHEGDVVILAHVSSGAEVRATGHVHIYAKVEGRVFAGVNGYEKAKIFTRSMDAEMLSIAGVFVLYEQLEPFRNQPNSFILGLNQGQMRIHPM